MQNTRWYCKDAQWQSCQLYIPKITRQSVEVSNKPHLLGAFLSLRQRSISRTLMRLPNVLHLSPVLMSLDGKRNKTGTINCTKLLDKFWTWENFLQNCLHISNRFHYYWNKTKFITLKLSIFGSLQFCLIKIHQ